MRMSRPVAFTGHMMDRVGRIRPHFIPRFPASSEARVVESVHRALSLMAPTVGYCSAACGGDLIFIEAMLARGAEVHVVLPYAEELFIRDCVSVPVGAGAEQQFQAGAGASWLERYNAVRNRFSSLLILGDRRPRSNSMASDYCNRVILGLALLRSRADGVPLRMLALWDGWSGDAPGGARSLVTLAEALGVEIEFLPDLHPGDVQDVVRAAVPPPGIGAEPFRAVLDQEPPQQICAVLFADVVRFGRLDETRLPAFVSGYLKPLAGIIQDARHGGYGPLDFNTWGDGLFCVFDSALKAGLFALEMQGLGRKDSWLGFGSGDELNQRIALHAGPVFRIPDPIFPKDTFVGTNISFAARIEPVTAEGEIWCSQSFAAIAAAEGVRDFDCECVGHKVLPKITGEYPLYRLSRVSGQGR